jgi:hypothetical protein
MGFKRLLLHINDLPPIAQKFVQALLSGESASVETHLHKLICNLEERKSAPRA